MTLFCRLHSLKLTAKGPENQWLQYDLGMVAIFRGHVSFRGGNAGENPGGLFESHPNQRDQQDQLTNSFLRGVFFLQMMAAWLVFLFRSPHGFLRGR